MKKFAILAGLLSVSALAQVSGKLEIFSWWTAGGEADGLKALLDQTKKQNPNLEIINATVAGGAGTNAKAVLKTRMLGGTPPDSFQVHGGAELVDPWIKSNLMEKISDLWKSQGWEKVFPKDLQNMVRWQNDFYAVPVNIHRGNVLWYNTKIFKDNKLNPPKSFAEFVKVADALKAKGITPLALGSQGNWEITMLFENNLVAAGGAPFYRDLVNGKIAWTDKRVKDALQMTKTMMSYVNKDHTALSWDQASNLVLNGKAAMNVMGDWAKGFFQANKWTPDKEFSNIAAPGTSGNFMVITDTFGLPKKAPNMAAAKAWLMVLASKEGQEAFNLKKGSIPARTDVNRKIFDAMAQRTMDDFSKNALVPSIAHGSAVSEALVGAINDEMAIFAQRGDVESTAKRIESAAKEAGLR